MQPAGVVVAACDVKHLQFVTEQLTATHWSTHREGPKTGRPWNHEKWPWGFVEILTVNNSTQLFQANVPEKIIQKQRPYKNRSSTALDRSLIWKILECSCHSNGIYIIRIFIYADYISSYLKQHLETLSSHMKRLTCYFDSCFGQNKNFQMVCLWNEQVSTQFVISWSYVPSQRPHIFAQWQRYRAYWEA